MGIAKARLKAMGVGNINRKFGNKKDGIPLWKAVLFGKSGEDAERAQMNLGKLIKAQKHGQEFKNRRIIRKVEEA